MTHADAFLEAILDHPDDDAVRLIYADWLDEHGDVPELRIPKGAGGKCRSSRAEFIRVQCALASGQGKGRRAELQARETELWQQHSEDWAGLARRMAQRFEFRRGFLDELWLKWRAFFDYGESLLLQAPVQSLYLVQATGAPAAEALANARRLGECFWLQRLRHLDLRDNALGSAGVEALSVCEHFDALTSLVLSDNRIGDAGLRALVTAPLFLRLTHLDLSKNEIGPTGARHLTNGVRQLLDSGAALPLEEIDLRENRLGQSGVRELKALPLLRRVVRV